MALGLEKMETKVMKEKLGFFKRLDSNVLTRKLLDTIGRCEYETKKLSKKSILKQITEYLEYDELDYEDINLIIGPKIKELSKHITNRINDSIRTCLDNINNKEYRDLLVKLVKPY